MIIEFVLCGNCDMLKFPATERVAFVKCKTCHQMADVIQLAVPVSDTPTAPK